MPQGKVVIDGKSIRKGISKKRWTANNAVRKIFGTLQNLQFVKVGKSDNNKDVILAYGVLDTEIKRYNKVVIDKKSGKVISLHDIGKKAFEKERPVAR